MSGADSERVFASAVGGTLVLLACTVLLMGAALVLSVRRAMRRRRRERVLAAWRAAFIDAPGAPPPPLPRAYEFAVLRLWVDFNRPRRARSHVAPETKARLDELARRCRFDRIAMRLAQRRDADARLVGVTALGALGETRGRALAEAMCADPDGDVSCAAAAALVALDGTQAERFCRLLRDRPDWDRTSVEPVLDADPDRFAAPFIAAFEHARDEQRRRLLPFAELLGDRVVRYVSLRALDDAADDEVVAAALRALRQAADPCDAPRLAAFAEHPAAAVRVQAVNALAALTTPRARDALIARLHDENAWVRLRAAEALARTVERTSEREQIVARLGADRFAREALTFAFEEREA